MLFDSVIASALTNSYSFIYHWSYLGIFVLTLLDSASIIFPPTLVLVFTFGNILNPFVLAMVASLGYTLGLTVSYLLGLGFKELMEKKYARELSIAKNSFVQHGGFLWIALFSLMPMLPDKMGSIFCGTIRYDFKKFLLAVFVGKIISSIFLAYAGYYSINWVADLFRITSPLP